MTETLKPLGPRIKVRVDSPEEEKSSGGIVLQLKDKQEDNETGVVTELGAYAYGNFKENWVDVGDKVLFQRYAGKPREDHKSDGTIEYYRILKDVDVIGVFKNE